MEKLTFYRVITFDEGRIVDICANKLNIWNAM
jgi:hypothetical protein